MAQQGHQRGYNRRGNTKGSKAHQGHTRRQLGGLQEDVETERHPHAPPASAAENPA